MEDVFADTTYGKIALEKLKPTGADFRLFFAGWLGKHGDSDVMEVKGAQFRESMRGQRKGQLCILVCGTERTAYVTAAEMKAFELKGHHE